MTSIQIDVKDGLSSSTAIKGPVKAATATNITLSGAQTIDGVSIVTDDRVLVKNQTTASENGIYIADTGPWRRAKDFNKTRDVKQGTLVIVNGGTVGAGIWQVTTADPISIGTSNITFQIVSNAALAGTTPGATGLALLAAASVAAAWGIVSAGMAFADTSSVVGSAAKMWNPTYFGNPGTAIVHRLNRLLVGEATGNSSDIPASTKSWLENILTSTVAAAQFASVSATGNLGVVGAARTSDYRTWAGAASGGSQGVTGFGWNDDTTPATTPIAVGAEFRGFRKATVNGITLGAQISAANEGSTVDLTPSGGVTSGSTMALLLTNGPGPTGYVNPISAGLVFGSGSGTEVMRKGIIMLATALDTSVGGGGQGIAFESARGQSFRWLNSGGTSDAEIWGNASGLITSKSIVPSANDGAALGTATASFADLFLADGGVINWNNGVTTVTESASGLTVNNRISTSVASLAAYFKNTTDSASNEVLRLESRRATRANFDSAVVDWYIANSAGTATAAMRLGAVMTNVTAGAETAAFSLSLTNAGAGLSTGYNWTPANYYPNANDAAALGLAGTAWADLFLASGAVINFNNGNYTFTHTAGILTASGAILSAGATGGVGYATGAGGTVTQATSKSTGVTLNKACGEITMNAAALAASTTVSFVLTDSAIAAGDTLNINHVTTGTFGSYTFNARCGAGSATIDVRNVSLGSLSEAIVIRFELIKGVTA